MANFTFTGPKREDMLGGWARTVKIGEQEYQCSVRRGRRVRIPYKPRGKNWGSKWNGAVYRTGTNHGLVWSGDIPGSLGCRGLLIEAGIIPVKALDSP